MAGLESRCRYTGRSVPFRYAQEDRVPRLYGSYIPAWEHLKESLEEMELTALWILVLRDHVSWEGTVEHIRRIHMLASWRKALKE